MSLRLFTTLMVALFSCGCSHTIGIHVDGESALKMQAGETYSFVVGGLHIDQQEIWETLFKEKIDSLK